MSKRILIIGPSGSGKTYISAALRAKGINSIDADLLEGLADWFNGSGRKVQCPMDAGPEFLNNHEFLWDRGFLNKFLEGQNEAYLFGSSGNVFDMLDLFDRVYFLKASPELLADRLRHESRKNPMGKTDYQLQNALKWAKEIEQKASSLHIEMINADQTPEVILNSLRR